MHHNIRLTSQMLYKIIDKIFKKVVDTVKINYYDTQRKAITTNKTLLIINQKRKYYGT